MAKFSEEFVFTSLNIREFYRLPIAFDGSSFYINVGRNSVIKVHDRKVHHNWALKFPHLFTSPVVFNEIDDTLCCITNNYMLTLWSLDDNTLEQGTKIKFQDSLHAILPLPKQRPLVVFTSGKCCYLNSNVSSSQPLDACSLPLNEEIIWTDAACCESDIILLYLTRDKTCQKYILHKFVLHEENVVSHVFIALTHQKALLRSWCMKKCAQAFSFLALWSDGSIVSYPVHDLHDSLLMKLPDISSNTLVALDIIEWPHIAVCKLNFAKKESILEIWDVQFFALLAQKQLKTPFSSHLQLAVYDSSIFVPSKEDLIKVPFVLQKSTLAKAIGKSKIACPVVKEYKWNNLGQLCPLPCNKKTSEKLEIHLRAKKFMQKATLKHIQESEIVDLLLYAIQKKKEATNSDSLLNLIFCASYSDVFLMRHLKRLSFQEALVTLEILLTLLKDSSEKPTDLQILNWIILVVQTHFQDFFSQDQKVSELLQEVSSVISEKMEYYKLLSEIGDYLTLVDKNIILEDYEQDIYRIEPL